MDEARKFLRYVMPGLAFGTLTLLWIFIADPETAKDIFQKINKESALSAALGGLLMSGALGYIFSTIHHSCHCFCNKLCAEKNRILDHRSIATEIRNITGENTVSNETKNETQEEAMAFSYTHWFNQMRLGNINNDANNKVSSLGDQAHGLGAAWIASFFSLPAALVICFIRAREYPCHFLHMFVPWFLITYSFIRGYERIGIIAHEMYKKILLDAINKPKKSRLFIKKQPPCLLRKF